MSFAGVVRKSPWVGLGAMASLFLVGATVAFVVAAIVVFDPTLWSKLTTASLASLPRLLLGKGAFWIVVALVTVVPAALSAHYRLIGPKTFSHEGRARRVFSVATRINHWVAAVSCTLLILTGVFMMCGGTWGFGHVLQGGRGVRLAWDLHAVMAVVFGASALFMLVAWARDMLPRAHDLRWVGIAGGYLSRVKRPVPAHRFNAGQKSWFWLATLGGLAMGATGYLLHEFEGGLGFLNAIALAHHVIATLIVAMYVVHVYMAVFAIKGSLGSMVHGKKSEEELAILHSLYYRGLQQTALREAEVVD